MLELLLFKDDDLLSREQLLMSTDDAIAFAKNAVRLFGACGAKIIAGNEENEVVWEAGYIPNVKSAEQPQR